MPVAAVRVGGRPRVKTGSRITVAGSSSGWLITRLTFSSLWVNTASRPSSEPVPAVVGKAIKGGSPRRGKSVRVG
ncbi:hypothetical protein D9M71_816500 [compost metagenome]